MVTDPGPHLFWITSRAAGSVALVLASLSVCLGLLMATRLVKDRGPDLRVGHEILSLATLAAIAVHGLALLGDGFIKDSLLDIAVPFVGHYKNFWTSLGIIAGWGLAVLGLAYYVRARIGVARWRVLHRFTAAAWILGLVHAIATGTDAGEAWFLAMIGIVVVPALALLVARLAGGGPRSPRQPRRTPEPA
jgi:methionine sulfoxide reductase heme-binding subunit